MSETQLDRIENKLGNLEQSMTAGFAAMDLKFETLIDNLAIMTKEGFDRIDARFDRLEARSDRLEYKTGTLDVNAANHEGRISRLEERNLIIEKKLAL